MIDLLQKYVLPPVIIGLGGLVLASMYLNADTSTENYAGPQLAVVKVAQVLPHNDGFKIQVDGVVVPLREVTLAAEVSGKVAFKNPSSRAGEFVEKDTLLYQVDPSNYQFEVDRLTQLLEQSKSDLEEWKVDKFNTERLKQLAQQEVALQFAEVKRLAQLLGRGVTQSELDRETRVRMGIENRYLNLENQFQILEKRQSKVLSAIRLAQTQLDKADLDLTRTKIIAPMDGIVVEDMVEEGDYVQVGSAMVAIEDTVALEVKCNLEMQDLYWLWSLKTGLPVRSDEDKELQYEIPKVDVDVTYHLAGREKTNYRWSGQLSRYGGSGLDEKTRTVPCRVRVDQPTGVTGVQLDQAAPPALMRGMFVTVEIPTIPRQRLMKVPESSIQPGRKIWRIRRRETDSVLNLVENLKLVKLIEDNKQKYWIVDPSETELETGDQIVVSPLADAYDGMSVQFDSEN